MWEEERLRECDVVASEAAQEEGGLLVSHYISQGCGWVGCEELSEDTIISVNEDDWAAVCMVSGIHLFVMI